MIHLPFMFYPAALLLGGLLTETWIRRRLSWALSAALVYLMVGIWYFADLFVVPENYAFLPDALMNVAYLQVIAFLATYRLLVPPLTKKFSRNAKRDMLGIGSIHPSKLFVATIVVWGIVLGFGVYRMDGDVLNSLFPLGSRTAQLMWGRESAGDAGATGFLVSAGGYIYQLLSALFGVWFFVVRTPGSRLAAALMMLISWPYFALSGTRNIFLAVALPSLFAYMLISRHKLPLKLVNVGLCLLALNASLKVIISHRDTGFAGIFTGTEDEGYTYADATHNGLNMIQELCFVDVYVHEQGLTYGNQYFVELLGVIPRAIWAGKPLMNVEYAVWRGFGGGDSDIGVFATISTGVIGGGVRSFGNFFGPFFPALLMALWTAILVRWWEQRAAWLRYLLFLAGQGLTLNLGRDFTLLVLWPVVFGYVMVRIVEKITSKSEAPSDRRRIFGQVRRTRANLIAPSKVGIQ